MDRRVPVHQEGRDRQLTPAAHHRSLQRCGGTLIVAAVLGACSSVPPRPAALLEGPTVQLDTTPFFPQREHECGPAALATLLGAAGQEASPEVLAPLLLVPGFEGSLQPELLAQARRRGFVAQPIAPTLAALVAELRAGRPVLVLQNNGLGWYPKWHYAVVIGYDPGPRSLTSRADVAYAIPRASGRRYAR